MYFKRIVLILFVTVVPFIVSGQVVSGIVLDASTNEPVEFACVGIMNTPVGVVTNGSGQFFLDISGQLPDNMVRISMISYKEVVYTVEQLKKHSIIMLVPSPVHLPEVIIKPGKSKKVGVANYTRIGHWCGWGGTEYARGWEKGTCIRLGDRPVQLLNFNIHMQRQSFDSSFYRLHIRSMVNDMPADELLTRNIIFKASKESGWITVDLRNYNIILKGDVAVTIEWVKVCGVIKNRAMTFSGGLQTEYVLFNTKAKDGPAFDKRGPEDKWRRLDHHRPAMYLTVQ